MSSKRSRHLIDGAGRPVLALALLLALVACAGRGAEDDSTPRSSVPPGTPLIEHPVPAAESRVDLAVERQIELRDPGGTLQLGLGYTRISAAPGGRVVVLGSEARRLAVFDAQGVLQSQWGEMGTQAGQLFGPVGLAVIGDEVVVADAAAMRLSRWRLNGEYVTEVSGESLQLIDAVVGALDEGLLVKVLLRTELDDLASVTLFSLEGREQRRFVQLLPDYSPLGQSIWPRPDAVVAPGGRVYATDAAEYEVQAIEPDGAFAWVLRVPWPRSPLSEEAQRTIERTQRAGRALGANVEDTRSGPQALPALQAIEVDGRGRLYVFPFVEPGSVAERYPVDVYDEAAGRRIATGWLPFQGWDAQADDVVYRLEVAEDGETVIARYRLAWE